MTEPRSIFDYFPEDALALLKVTGPQLVENLGLAAIADVVGDVLCGHNVRNATESLTRRRIALLNAALLVAYLRGAEETDDFIARLPERARQQHERRGAPPAEKQFLRWTLGLTQKQVQNVLRSNEEAWGDYIERFVETLHDVAQHSEENYGRLQEYAVLESTSGQLDWQFALYLLTAIGSQTLGIRGSEKSLYGKFFEKLVLVGALHALGFSFIGEGDLEPMSFQLSSRGAKRESDATLLFDRGQGVRFDIGFIGPGNTEISLDKVSRFEREAEFGGHTVYLRTIILVDRIGKGSRITDLAAAIDGTILQMSLAYWPQALGGVLEDTLSGYHSPFHGRSGKGLETEIRSRAASAPYERALQLVAEDDEAVEDDVEDDE